ncbi:MAG: LON peptidase substrate-binding domain-containing protein, partial [Oscillospiraceae bacterium]
MSEKVKVKIETSKNISLMPVIALRGLVVFPNNIIHFEVGREKSVSAVEWAIENNSQIFLVAQKDMDVDEPQFGDLYTYGVVANVKQLLRISDNLVKVLVEGKYRAKLCELKTSGTFLQAQVKPARIRMPSVANADHAQALVRQIKDVFQTYVELNPHLPKEVIYTIFSNENIVFLSQFIPTNILFGYEDKQAILDENSLIGRLETIL